MKYIYNIWISKTDTYEKVKGPFRGVGKNKKEAINKFKEDYPATVEKYKDLCGHSILIKRVCKAPKYLTTLTQTNY
jgi:hypothetical protein